MHGEAQNKFLFGREAVTRRKIGVKCWKLDPEGNIKKVSKGAESRELVVKSGEQKTTKRSKNNEEGELVLIVKFLIFILHFYYFIKHKFCTSNIVMLHFYSFFAHKTRTSAIAFVMQQSYCV